MLRKEPGIAENPIEGVPSVPLREGETIFRKPFTVKELALIEEKAKADPFIHPLIVTGMCPAMRRSSSKLGRNISSARRKHRLTIAMMAERMGVAPDPHRRVEKGDPSVAMGVYAMALSALGFGGVLGDLIDAKRDEIGPQLDEERKRVRVKKSPAEL